MDNPYGEKAPLVNPDEFHSWILQEDDDLLIINKPGWLVCHPSKNGPYSSLVGAVGEYLGEKKIHLVARLDRETSGLVIFAKRPAVARRYQMAIQNHKVSKCYLALMVGEFENTIHIDQPIGRVQGGMVHVKSTVKNTNSSKNAVTDFIPLVSRKDYTLCRIEPTTGRKHQIRVHAEWLGHCIVGDKIYGPDESLYIEFIEKGWTERLATVLPIQRQALHCYCYSFNFDDGSVVFNAPLLDDMKTFCSKYMNLGEEELNEVINK